MILHHVLLIVSGFNDKSTIVGHFVSSPRERERRDRRDSRGDEREEQGRKRKMNENEETEEKKKKKKKKKKHPPSTHICCKDSRPCPIISQYQLDAPVIQDTQHLCPTQPFHVNHLLGRQLT